MLGELHYDLKGRKKKRLDWITLAEKCSEVVDYYDGSVAEAAEKLPISTSTLNAILRLKKLDPRVQDLVRRGDILFDSAQRLNTIAEPDRQYEVAKMIVGLSNKKQREMIQHALRFPESNQLDHRNKVAKEMVRQEKITVVVIPMRRTLSFVESRKRQIKEAD